MPRTYNLTGLSNPQPKHALKTPGPELKNKAFLALKKALPAIVQLRKEGNHFPADWLICYTLNLTHESFQIAQLIMEHAFSGKQHPTWRKRRAKVTEALHRKLKSKLTPGTRERLQGLTSGIALPDNCLASDTKLMQPKQPD